MLTEIDKDFYCSIGAFTGKDKCSVGSCNYFGCGIPSQFTKKCTDNDCGFFHRKYPTPEQFKEEYGEEWTGAVYYRRNQNKKWSQWFLVSYEEYKFNRSRFNECVLFEVFCACTPFKPPKNWRLEYELK